MRNAKCDKCGGEFQTNETLKVRESIVCQACAESIFAEERITADQVQRQADPTVCVECGFDNGDTDLGKLAGLPVCPQCEALFRNRPFPAWVKAALMGMVVLVVFALVWNSRFIRAYYELRCFGSTMAAGDFERGAAYFISASKRVPENAELQIYARYYEGRLLLSRGKCAEALELLQSCQGKIHDDYDLDGLIMQARVGIDRTEFDKRYPNGWTKEGEQI